jgi:hypothetical protein
MTTASKLTSSPCVPLGQCDHRATDGADLFPNYNVLGFDAGDANLYRYIRNAPTNATDPNGTEAENPRTFPNKQTEKKNQDDLFNLKKAGAKYLNENLFEVKTVEGLQKRIKPGEVFKYVIKEAKFIIILHGKDKKIPHSVGTIPLPIKDENIKAENIGQPVEAAGRGKYFLTNEGKYRGMLFDLKTGHYQINDDPNWREAKARAETVLKKFTPRYTRDIEKNKTM